MIDEDVFRQAILGYSFQIADKKMHLTMSKTKLKNFGSK